MGKTLRSITVMFCFSAIALGQQPRGDWKEYVYNNDGFAVTVPFAPTRHPDRQIPRTTNYDCRLKKARSVSASSIRTETVVPP
jgi:hypothetical protein